MVSTVFPVEMKKSFFIRASSAGMQHQGQFYFELLSPRLFLVLGWSWGTFIPPGTAPQAISDH